MSFYPLLQAINMGSGGNLRSWERYVNALCLHSLIFKQNNINLYLISLLLGFIKMH